MKNNDVKIADIYYTLSELKEDVSILFETIKTELTNAYSKKNDNDFDALRCTYTSISEAISNLLGCKQFKNG